MTDDTFTEIDRDIFRKKFNQYTRKAFYMLPELSNPRILDIGCGSGEPTIELAALCKGEIIGIDIDQSGLNKLNSKIKAKGLTNRVKAMKCSLFDIDFPNESFDILWAEGVITTIGFERGLKEWRRLIKPKGFLVVHDDIRDMDSKLSAIPSCKYKLLNHFLLPGDTWWKDYYEPLEVRVNEIALEYKNNPAVLKTLHKYQNEIKRVKRMKKVNSVFFIMQKM
ncbi:MAG: class I SAM-dependent methyltransferase [Candidatus Heimdallarchaeota archaeon]|nr:MAG: class I SAM-dependent methyltransferase [Candidatus Heimdallarchaeota archaeon]